MTALPVQAHRCRVTATANVLGALHRPGSAQWIRARGMSARTGTQRFGVSSRASRPIPVSSSARFTAADSTSTNCPESPPARAVRPCRTAYGE
ncbi:hypothetical protein SMICM17S_08676 [Streptomyces microflavus]